MEIVHSKLDIEDNKAENSRLDYCAKEYLSQSAAFSFVSNEVVNID